MLIEAEAAVLRKITIEEFCPAVGISARSFYYWKKQRDSGRAPAAVLKPPPPPPQNKLKPQDQALVRQALLRPDWAELSPREIYYKLMDEQRCLIASISTFYRIARKTNLLVDRRKPSTGRKLNREIPHLLAQNPNEVWSWDISQIQSSRRLERYYLYVIIDIWSRFVVGWCLEDQEKTECAIGLWKKSLEDQALSGQGLINHKDNGAMMTSDEMIKFVRDAQMVDSYSRAGVSDDNPFSESLFRTVKYFRDFPDHFESIEAGRTYFEQYFKDYNWTYKHSGIQFIEPAARHYGEEPQILSNRNQVIAEFYQKNPHRYSGPPQFFKPIREVRIN